jgi:ATP-dependent RNA helicase RhlE
MLLLFNQLDLNAPIQKALETQGYTKPTAIQEQAIPHLLKGRDLLGAAQTGTGKTAAFALPILQKIAEAHGTGKGKRPIKAIIIAPTRELAIQISDSFKKYGANLPSKTAVIYGGVSQHPQTRAFKKGVDIVVATPGRLLDLINQGHVKLNQAQHFVLDEADLMLDMGMIDDVKKIVKYLPNERQTMLFSATMPNAIEKLTKRILKDPIKVEVTPVSTTVDTIKQKVYFIDKGNKTNLLIDLLKRGDIETALVFSRTKRGANQIVKALNNNGLSAEAIHGNKSQNARQKALKNFKQRKIKILVATDIAARGIDIDVLSHVINYNLPEVPETYVHRIGRTGRAGENGVAISFCAHEEKGMLKGIQKLIGKTIPEIKDHKFPLRDTTTQPKGRGRRRGRRKGKNARNRNKNSENFKKDSRGNYKKRNKRGKKVRNR